ncbi:MAG TPA: TraR/DksA C4-type zinc finger protein [Candidatus Synoicihabitans sp.]|nr:TraR/DksA C4-type zinc finger protein [Candidatus Synoicihabitans sp.]
MSKSSSSHEKSNAKPAPNPKADKPERPEKAPAAGSSGSKKASARDLLRSRILGRQKNSKPIAFSLDEVRELAKAAPARDTTATGAKPVKGTKTTKLDIDTKPAKPNHVGAASLADILGFNPANARRVHDDDSAVPEKFRKFYRLLIDLRNHVTGQLDVHTEDTLKRSAKDDAGDLSSYGQHMADAGTDTFDRDFALSLVSSEQEALSEIEAAIRRIKDGSYGICEVTQKPIAKERLLAVPFTRYSAEAQKEIERNRHRARTQAGLFGEMGEEGAKISDESDDD